MSSWSASKLIEAMSWLSLMLSTQVLIVIDLCKPAFWRLTDGDGGGNHVRDDVDHDDLGGELGAPFQGADLFPRADTADPEFADHRRSWGNVDIAAVRVVASRSMVRSIA